MWIDEAALVKPLQQEVDEERTGGTPGLPRTSLTRDSLREQTYLFIRSAIVTGALQPGEIYPVKFFADRVGVSRTPVREALLDLAGRGFVEVLPNRGFRITAVTEKEQDEIAAVRSMLEVPAMGLVARLITVKAISKARLLCANTVETARCGDLPRFLETDHIFHLYLIDQCGNRRLTQMVAELRDRMHLHGMPRLAETGALVTAGAEHTELVDALAAHDERRAQEVITHHLKHLRSDWAGVDAFPRCLEDSQT